MTGHPFSRRRFLGGTLALAAAGSPLLTACGGSDSKTLTMVTWGGTTATGFEEAYAKPFTEKTGIAVDVIEPVDYGKYTAQLDSGNITWDWVDIEGWFAFQHIDKWAELDRDVIKIDDADLVQLPGRRSIEPWGTPSGSYSFVISYRTDNEDPHPTSWEEFFDPDAVPGKRSIYNWPYGMLEAALLGDGVAFDDLYPLDIDRALGKLDSVRDDLVFWNSGAELQQQLTNGTVPFAFAWNNRVAYLGRRGEPVDIEWAENIQDGGYDVSAKDNPSNDDVMKLLAFSSGAEPQAQMALATGYSPATKSALAKIPTDDLRWYNAHQPNIDAAIGSLDLEWWAENMTEASDRWSAWASS
ncbi:MAG: substrate-binding domain-containing protein [Nocardioidaceae bacterium]